MYKWYYLFDNWVYLLFILYLFYPKIFLSPIFLYLFVIMYDLDIIININKKYEIVKDNNLKINKIIILHRLFLFVCTHLLPIIYLLYNFEFNLNILFYSMIVITIYLIFLKYKNIKFTNFENIELNNNSFKDYIQIRYSNNITFIILSVLIIYISFYIKNTIYK